MKPDPPVVEGESGVLSKPGLGLQWFQVKPGVKLMPRGQAEGYFNIVWAIAK